MLADGIKMWIGDPVINLSSNIPRRCRGVWSRAPHLLNLDTIWSRVVNFISQPLKSQGNIYINALRIKGWVCLWAGLDALGKWNSPSLSGIEHELPGHSPSTLITNTSWAISAVFYATNKVTLLHFGKD